MEIGDTEMKGTEYYKLSSPGVIHINWYNRIFNTSSMFHEYCSNDDTLYKSLTDEILYLDDEEFNMIDARESSLPGNMLQSEDKLGK